ncbi:Mov34/MPN/PAD-1 family protein [[Eubacterium] cellulosolvens]
MFNVRISTHALQRIAIHTRKPYEQIGLLLGNFVNQELNIFDTVEGGGQANDMMSIFSSDSMARIAQGIMAGRVQGNIVGWYHSHIRGGIFMSDIDIQTQLKLQQFSPYIVALVIDPQENEFGIFTYSTHTGPIQIPENQIIVY